MGTQFLLFQFLWAIVAGELHTLFVIVESWCKTLVRSPSNVRPMTLRLRQSSVGFSTFKHALGTFRAIQLGRTNSLVRSYLTPKTDCLQKRRSPYTDVSPMRLGSGSSGMSRISAYRRFAPPGNAVWPARRQSACRVWAGSPCPDKRRYAPT
jgi:hypothetical protein